MISTKRRKTFLPPLVLASLLSLLTLTQHLTALAQGPTLHLDKAGSIDTGELDLLHPTGLAYSPADNIFFVSPANTTSATLTTLSPFENLIGQVTIPAKVDSLNLTFDPRTRGLLLFDFAANDLLEIKIGPLGLPDPATVTRIEAQLFGLQQPQGMTFDPVGRLFILDQPGPRLVRIQPDLTPGLDSATALKQGQVSQVDLSALGLGNIRGLAFNPANGHLYLLNPASQSLYELTETGQWVTTFDLSSFRLNDPQGLVFGPSRDTTDDPSFINLYIASSGLAVQSGQNPLPGEIIELTFKESALDALVVDMQATLVRTTLTSQFSPPSPDPSGLAYLTSSNTLLISDGEVEEMSIFAGKNLFQTSLSGSLVGTFTTLPFSDEPAGVAYNPFNQHLFFSDDTDQKHVFELNPGADGQYNTADDSVTSFTTSAFGSFDPEGIAYNTWQNQLFVVDGVNEEVYRIMPGGNGLFDGVSPAGDDNVTHFDITSLGMKDPEGIEFNPDNGHLYILSGKAEALIETTTSGALVQTIGIAAVNNVAAAGLAYVPATKHFYIVDRGIDNGTNPKENDGKLYEIALGPATTVPPGTVTLIGPPTGAVHTSYLFTASVSPSTTTLPLTYVWEATGQPSVTHSAALSDTLAFTWDAPGLKDVTVTANNGSGAPVQATAQIMLMAPSAGQSIYLPLVIRQQGSAASDLIITGLEATNKGVAVVISNQGAAPVVDAFWVDVYFNPTITPALNQRWSDIASHGQVWAVTGMGLSQLTPGGTLTLTSDDDFYFPQLSSAPPLPSGANINVFALADSINFDTNYGVVQESNEANNLFGPVNSTTGATEVMLDRQSNAGSTVGLPARQ